MRSELLTVSVILRLELGAAVGTGHVGFDGPQDANGVDPGL